MNGMTTLPLCYNIYGVPKGSFLLLEHAKVVLDFVFHHDLVRALARLISYTTARNFVHQHEQNRYSARRSCSGTKYQCCSPKKVALKQKYNFRPLWYTIKMPKWHAIVFHWNRIFLSNTVTFWIIIGSLK